MIWGSACLGVLAWGCAPETDRVDSLGHGVVARVDSATVAAAQLRAFVEQLPTQLRPQRSGDDARAGYLRSLLAKHLLAIEARARGLGTAPELQANLMTRWRQHILEVYRREVLADQVRISEADIRAYFTAKGLDRRRQVAGILVDEEALAREIHARLAAGEDFATLAQQHTIDERSADRGGLLGFVDIEQARKLRIPDAVFLKLKIGQISKVLPMGKRYQLVRFLQDQPVPLAEKRQQIRDALYARGLAQAEQREIRHLERKLQLRLVPEGVEMLQDKAGLYSRVRRSNLSAEESAQPLFVYKGGMVTLGDYVDILGRDMRSLTGWGVQDGAEVTAAAGELVLGKWLLFEAARRVAITDGREERRWLEATRRELMIRQLRQEEIIDKVQIEREDAREFYEDHPELFRESGEYHLVEVMVGTEAEAAALRKQIGLGETISSLAEQHTLHPDMRAEAGMTHMGDYERLTRPLLYGAVQRAALDEVVGPVAVDGGYSLFKVLDRQGGEVQSFLEVEPRARALLRGQQRELRFEEWIDALMDKYDERIVVSAPALAQALPDTFLQRLDRESAREN